MQRDRRGSNSPLRVRLAAEQPSARILELEALLGQIEKATTHYEVLGLARSATEEAIRLAHQQAVTVLHPSHYSADLIIGDDMMTRVDSALTRVSEAFSVLVNVVAKINYDNFLDQRPRCERLGLCIAASVTGYDQTQGKWHEITRTVEVGRAGVSLRMRRRVAPGSILQLTLPLPVELRNHGHSNPAYDVFAIVRRIESVTDSIVEGGSLVEIEFLGERPPVGYLSKPWATFEISSSPGQTT